MNIWCVLRRLSSVGRIKKVHSFARSCGRQRVTQDWGRAQPRFRCYSTANEAPFITAALPLGSGSANLILFILFQDSHCNTHAMQFPQFSRLAPELRQTIWSMTIEPREVIVDWQPERHGHESPFGRPFIAKMPSAFQVCRESRATVQGSYQQVFCDPSQSPEGRYAWVNFALDSIRLHQEGIPLLSKDSKSSLVRHLTVECSDGKAFHGSRRTEGHGQCIVFLRELQSLTVIMPEINERSALIRAYARSELMLRSYYGTCKPVHFDTRILFPGLPAFHKDNFAFEISSRAFQLFGTVCEDARKRRQALI